MRVGTLFLLIAVWVFAAPGDVAAQGSGQDQASDALQEFIGDWEMVPIAPLGSTGEARSVRFRANGTYTTFGENGNELWSGTFNVDPTVSPKTFDHRSFGMRDKDPPRDILGIYERNGEVIRISVTPGRWQGDTWDGRLRATHFNAADGYSVIEFRGVTDDK